MAYSIKQTAACFRTEWKRGSRLVPSFFAAAFLLACVLAAASIIFCRVLEKREVIPKIRAAIVIPDGDSMTSLAAGYVEGMDSVKDLVTISTMDKEKAMDRLEEGKLDVVILLAENMYESVDQGENPPVHVLYRKDSALNSLLFRNLVKSGVCMLQTSEAAVYSIEEVSLTYPLTGSVHKQINKMAKRYLSLVMNRNRIWENTEVSAYGALDTLQFYAEAVMLAVVLIFGIGFAGFYDRNDRIIRKLLHRNGVSWGMQSLARVSAMVFPIWLILLAGYLLISIFLQKADLHPVVAGELLLIAFAVACMIHLIYVIFQREGAALFYLLVITIVFIVGGGLIPSAYLPAFLQPLTNIIPISSWQQLGADIFRSGSVADAGRMMIVAVQAAIMFLLGTLGYAL